MCPLWRLCFVSRFFKTVSIHHKLCCVNLFFLESSASFVFSARSNHLEELKFENSQSRIARRLLGGFMCLGICNF
jgi:hypothetical protein